MQEAPKGDVKWLSVSQIPLIRVRPRRQFAVVPLGEVLSIYTHFIQELRRTQPCLMGECPACETHVVRRPLAYLAVAYFCTSGGNPRWSRAILEVPYSCAGVLGSLKGQVVAVKRERPFGPVNVGKFFFSQELPDIKPFKIVDMLLQLWRTPPGKQLCLVSQPPFPNGREEIIDT